MKNDYKSQMKQVTIYTDGACKGNPGNGGYGVVLSTQVNGKIFTKELSQGYILTTNNRMELLAVIKALEVLKYPCNVNLYCDSKYVVDSVNKQWLNNWEKNNWQKGNSEVKNVDLWKRLMPLLKTHNINFFWVKGHNNDKDNERCDYLASNALKSNNLLIDEEYIKTL